MFQDPKKIEKSTHSEESVMQKVDSNGSILQRVLFSEDGDSHHHIFDQNDPEIEIKVSADQVFKEMEDTDYETETDKHRRLFKSLIDKIRQKEKEIREGQIS